MKKFLVALGLATVLSMPSVFAYTFYVEPESDTAVSFNVYDVLDGNGKQHLLIMQTRTAMTSIGLG